MAVAHGHSAGEQKLLASSPFTLHILRELLDYPRLDSC